MFNQVSIKYFLCMKYYESINHFYFKDLRVLLVTSVANYFIMHSKINAWIKKKERTEQLLLKLYLFINANCAKNFINT